jgi:5-methylcytosine-specific restriction endonuclease McrA
LVSKPLEDFNRDCTKKDGLRSDCKTCKSIRDKAYREPRKELYRERSYAWKAENYDRFKAQSLKAAMKRYWYLKDLPALPDDWKQTVKDFYGKCLKCGTTEDLTVDHVVSIAHGGSHTFDNLQCLCRVHNSRKGTSDTDYRNGWIMT